ncbi:MAG TPA: PQQ-binding-like beta-propeller repeat protein, partial [Thermotogota bacterium]|nr:PQQ-binding-like beta-propeller repeat protein [Thermotogota bacterium]
PYEFVAGNDRSLTAAFERDSFTLSVEAEPHAYGSVRVNGGAWAKVHQQEFELGSQVELRALAISGYGFLGWYENGQKISETNTYAFEMNSDRDLEANFFEVPPPWQTLVKAGTFEMGNTREDSEGEEREEPVTEFTLTNDFWIKTWEVTNEEFLEFLNNGGVSWNGYIHGNQILDVEDPDCEFYYEDFSFHYLEGRGNYPAVEMSWLGAAEYCNWLSQKEGYAKAYNSEGDLLDTEGATTADTTKVEGYRIPTEAEWEYSARGGHVDIVNGVEANDYKYAGSNDVDEVGWSHQDGGTHPVWRKEPNELGLYDMSGNVFEWVQDWWCNGYDELASENPIGPYDGSDAKIKRGGSYCSKDKAARVVHRIRMGFDTGPAEQGSAVDTGFRFVRTVIPPPVVEPGTVKWEYTADDEIWSSAAIASDGTIYFTCYDARLYALNSDGSNKWKYSIGGGGLFSSPAIGSDGTIYVGDGNGYLTAINSNGSFGWNFETDARVDSSPAIGSDGTIYVGSDDHNLYSISTDGGQNWEKDLGDYVISSPAIGSDGRIYVGSTSNPFYAVSPEVGGTSWINLNTGGVQSSPAIGSDGTIYVCGKDDHQVHALSTNGTEKTGWPFATGDDIFASPVIGSDGTIYVGSYDAYFYAINPDGTEKWKYQTGDKIDSSAAIGSDGTVYVGSHDQKLYALNSDGTLKWELDLGSEIGASPAIGSDGTIYVGTLSDKFFAVNGNSGGLADTPWPKFRQNEKNTGRDE